MTNDTCDIWAVVFCIFDHTLARCTSEAYLSGLTSASLGAVNVTAPRQLFNWLLVILHCVKSSPSWCHLLNPHRYSVAKNSHDFVPCIYLCVSRLFLLFAFRNNCCWWCGRITGRAIMTLTGRRETLHCRGQPILHKWMCVCALIILFAVGFS